MKQVKFTCSVLGKVFEKKNKKIWKSSRKTNKRTCILRKTVS